MSVPAMFESVRGLLDEHAAVELELNDDERALRRKTHETIRRVTQDLDPRVHLNTAVSGIMELVAPVSRGHSAEATFARRRCVGVPTSKLRYAAT